MFTELPPKNQGFTLLETLVAMVVFAIGMLGLGSFQAIAFKDSQDAYRYSLAAMSVYGIGDRIRANSVYWSSVANTYTTDETDTRTFYHCSADDDGDSDAVLTAISTPIVCSNAQLAEYDLYRWGLDVNDVLPGSTWTIYSIDDPDDGGTRRLIRISLSWTATNIQLGNAVPAPSYTLDIRPGIT